MRSLFLSPHADDEVLFGAFTIQKYRPHVVICFPSRGDYGDTEVRLHESQWACRRLGAASCTQLNLGVGLEDALKALDVQYAPDVVWAPSVMAFHEEHSILGFEAERRFGSRLRRYGTYMNEGRHLSRERWLPEVDVDDPQWIIAKLYAMADHASQIGHPRARQFFLWDLHEYADPA